VKKNSTAGFTRIIKTIFINSKTYEEFMMKCSLHGILEEDIRNKMTESVICYFVENLGSDYTLDTDRIKFFVEMLKNGYFDTLLKNYILDKTLARLSYNEEYYLICDYIYPVMFKMRNLI